MRDETLQRCLLSGLCVLLFPNGGQGFSDLFVLWPPLLVVFNASAGDSPVGIVLVGSLSVFVMSLSTASMTSLWREC